MPAGGTLTLRTFERERNIRIEVADTGKGLTPEEMLAAVHALYTTKQQNWLGLALVQIGGEAIITERQRDQRTRGAGAPSRLSCRSGSPRSDWHPRKAAPATRRIRQKTLAAASD